MIVKHTHKHCRTKYNASVILFHYMRILSNRWQRTLESKKYIYFIEPFQYVGITELIFELEALKTKIKGWGVNLRCQKMITACLPMTSKC